MQEIICIIVITHVLYTHAHDVMIIFGFSEHYKIHNNYYNDKQYTLAILLKLATALIKFAS